MLFGFSQSVDPAPDQNARDKPPIQRDLSLRTAIISSADGPIEYAGVITLYHLVAVFLLALGQADRPPKLDFNQKVDYVAWLNARIAKKGVENAWSRYAGFARNLKGEGGIPAFEGEAQEQWRACAIPWLPEKQPQLDEYLRQNSKQLETLARATGIRDCWIPVPNDSEPVNKFIFMLSKSSGYGCEAIIARAWKDQPDLRKALEEAHRVVLRNRRHLQQQQIVIGELAGAVNAISVYQSVILAMDTGVVRENDALNWYRQLFSDDPGFGSWQNIMITEWATTLSALQLCFPQGQHTGRGIAEVWKLCGRQGNPTLEFHVSMRKADPRDAVVTFEEYYPNVIEAGKGPPRWKNVDRLKQLSKELKERAKTNQIAMIFRLDFFGAYETLVSTEAGRRGMLLTLAIHAHHAKHGEWPEDLGKIDASLGMKDLKVIRVDPFTGKRFVYRVQNGKPFLYSIGADGVDDGGRHQGGFGMNGEGGDFVFWPRQRQ